MKNKFNWHRYKVTIGAMESLQTLCYESLAQSISDAPPIIQEMVISETKKQIRKRVREDIEKEVEEKSKKKIRISSLIEISELYSIIIPEIVTDIVASTVSNNRMRRNFRQIYPNIQPDVMDYAIEIAETIARTCIINRLETGEDDFYDSDGDSIEYITRVLGFTSNEDNYNF